MKKDFLTIAPDSGGGTAEVSVSADLNPNFKSRETSLTFSAGGGYLTSCRSSYSTGNSPSIKCKFSNR
jgi:hypothetical protein